MINFIRESNKIEGILRDPSFDEIEEMHYLMDLKNINVDDLARFVSVYQPNAELRDKKSIPCVRVGNHIAPRSGPDIVAKLNGLLKDLDIITPYKAHHIYETIHPFTDGNGRSGRALWAWHMQKIHGAKYMSVIWKRGFLHSWYYASLAENRIIDK